MKNRFDVVRAYPVAYTSNGRVYAEPDAMVRSLTFINTGTDDVTLYPGTFDVVLSTGDSFVLGGYQDSVRSEDVEFSFAGAVAPKLVVVKDLIQGTIICEPRQM